MARENSREWLAQITGWLGIFSGVFTLIVWCFLLSDLKPKIKVDHDDLLNDINKIYWRTTMFTFAPTVFFDIWTPLVMGLISILCHTRTFSFSWMCRTYVHYFIWNFALALFGNLGYAGGVGVICSAFSLLTALLSLICIFLIPERCPKLNLRAPQKTPLAVRS